MGSHSFRSLIALSFLVVGLTPTAASAYVVSTPGIGTQALIPSADTLTLGVGLTTTPLGTFNLQPGNYFAGDSGSLTGTFLYTFIEPITIDGDTVNVPISVQNFVTNADPGSPNTDFLTIFAGSPVFFAGPGVFLTIESYVSPQFSVGGSTDFTLQADLTAVPEPGSLALLGTGLIALGAMRRRRKAMA